MQYQDVLEQCGSVGARGLLHLPDCAQAGCVEEAQRAKQLHARAEREHCGGARQINTQARRGVGEPPNNAMSVRAAAVRGSLNNAGAHVGLSS